jgi:hypothetical protein
MLMKALQFVAFLVLLVGPAAGQSSSLNQCESELVDLCDAHFVIFGDPGQCSCIENTPEQNVGDNLDADRSVATMQCTAPKGCQPCLDTNTDVCYEESHFKYYFEVSASRGSSYCFETGSNRICTSFSSTVCRIEVDGVQCSTCYLDKFMFTANCTNIQEGAVLTFIDSGGPLANEPSEQVTSGFVGIFEPIANIMNGPDSPRCTVKDVEVEDVCGAQFENPSGGGDNSGGGNNNQSGSSSFGGVALGLMALITQFLWFISL